MKKIVMALALVMFAGLFWSQPAEARCWWNGYRWHCTHYRHYTHHYRHHYWHTRYYPYYYRTHYYAYYRPAYYFPFWPFCAY